MSEDTPGFLGRWSRRKAAARSGSTAPVAGDADRVSDGRPPAPAAAAAVAAPVARGAEGAAGAMPTSAPVAPSGARVAPPAAVAAADQAQAAPPPTMDDVHATPADASDFSRFVGKDVSADVQRAALRKMFSDPHFNVMDGLDIYIDDYGKPDPIPEAMLRKMVGARALGLFADDDNPAPPATGDEASVGAVKAPLESDENPDLLVQRHAAAGREGTGDGACEGGAHHASDASGDARAVGRDPAGADAVG